MSSQLQSNSISWKAASPEEVARLERRHPIYREHRQMWELYQAVWTGQLNETLQERFLPRGRTEEESLYRLRLQLSQWTPESQTLVRQVLNHVFRDRPDRRLEGHPRLALFLDRACPDGRGMDDLMYRSTGLALTFGMAFIVVDMPERPESLQAVSLEDEAVMGLTLPYAIVATPLDIYDWDVDSRDRVTYLKLVTHPSCLGPDGKRVNLTRYTEYTTEGWIRTDVKNSESTPQMRRISGEHGLGRVPVVQHAYEPIAPMLGRSYIELSARADVDIYQTESDRAYDRYDKAHPLLVIKSEDDLDRVYGKNFVVKLRPGEDAGYAAAGGGIFETAEEHIERRQRDLYRYGHVEPPIYKSIVESGRARLVAQEEEGRLYATVADGVERAEIEVWELAARWLSGPRTWGENERAFRGYIRYPDKFNVLTTEELVKLVRNLCELSAPEIVIREVKKQLWAQVLGSVAPEVLEEAAQITDGVANRFTVDQSLAIAQLAAQLHQAGVVGKEEVAHALSRLG